MMIGGFFLLNMWQDWFMSTKRHRELMEVMQAAVAVAKADGDRAHADADAKVASMRDAMKDRSLELRADLTTRVAEVRADSQAELDRLLKVVDAVQREVESWRQAFHLADQANREEDDARWTHIQAALTVLERFVTEVQRQVVVPQPPRELEPQRDGGT
jgi:hypothetical protein